MHALLGFAVRFMEKIKKVENCYGSVFIESEDFPFDFSIDLV